MQEKRLLYPYVRFEILECGAGLSMLGMPAEMKRVLSNLLENAVDATAERGMVRVSCRELHADRLLLIIEDNGPGIEPSVLARLGQLGFTSGKGEMGSGLGLHYCFTTIKKWGGELSISSELGRGTRASLLLKRHRKEGSTNEQAL